MNRKVLTTIKTYEMLAPGDSVVVGVSGGADSVALLHLLVRLREEWGIGLRALHLNHCLRGAESGRDEDFVRHLCRDWGVKFTPRQIDVAALAAEQKRGVEECARDERYRFFRQEAQERGGRVATGHTLSDSLETMLFNLSRGAALRGLCGIPPVRGNIIRPLIHCTRDEVEEYCRQNGLPYVTDSTNLQNVYTRNRIRHRVVPALRELHPGLEERVLRTLCALRQDEEYLAAAAAGALWGITRGEDYDRRGFLALHPALGNRVLVQLLEGLGIDCSTQRLELLNAMLRQGGGGVQLSEQLFFQCGPERFRFAAPAPRRNYFSNTLDLSPGEKGPIRVCVAGKTVNFDVFPRGNMNKFEICTPNQFKNGLDYDKIDKIVVIRQRLPGDKLALPGRNGTKTLKKLLNEYKVPPALRWSILVIDDGKGPVWVEGLGPHRRACVDGGTKRVLTIEVTEEENARGYTGSAHQPRGPASQGL